MAQSSANRLVIAERRFCGVPQNCTKLPDAQEFLVASRDGEPWAHLDSQGNAIKRPDASPRFDLYLVHRGLDTSDLKEAKSVLHDLRNPGGAPDDPYLGNSLTTLKKSSILNAGSV
jgi:hypothetical protein